jgi:hypothetical protein
MPKMTTVTIVYLRLFIPLGGKNLPHGNLWSVREKNSASELKVGKNNFFLISEMEGRRIRNPKNIISEALLPAKSLEFSHVSQLKK